MSVDVRERLDRAAGDPARGPDVAAAIARGDRLRRRRRVGVGSTALLVVAVTVAVGTSLSPGTPGRVLEVADRPDAQQPLPDGRTDPLASDLDLFEGPLLEEQRLLSHTVGGPGKPGVGLERPPERLRDPGFDEAVGAGDDRDIDASRARLATTVGELEVYLVPTSAFAEPVMAGGEDADGDWLYVYATAPGWRYWGSAPVPEPGEANWAGSFLYGVGEDMTLLGLVVVGDGLSTASTGTATVPVEGNVAVLEDVGYDSTVTFSGPAGPFTLTNPPHPEA